MGWQDDDGSGTAGTVIPSWAFEEMKRRAIAHGYDLDGLILTAALADELYPIEEFQKDEAARETDVQSVIKPNIEGPWS